MDVDYVLTEFETGVKITIDIDESILDHEFVESSHSAHRATKDHQDVEHILAGVGAEDIYDCQWYGTAPVCGYDCSSQCPGNRPRMRECDEYEHNRYAEPAFGADCLTGKKILCCVRLP